MTERTAGDDTPMIVYVTADSHAEAVKIGHILVEERLAACANIYDGVTTIYRWDDKIQEDDEVVLILKTQGDRLEELTGRVRELHSYKLPCIVAWPITTGNPAYLEWLRGETAV